MNVKLNLNVKLGGRDDELGSKQAAINQESLLLTSRKEWLLIQHCIIHVYQCLESCLGCNSLNEAGFYFSDPSLQPAPHWASQQVAANT